MKRPIAFLTKYAGKNTLLQSRAVPINVVCYLGIGSTILGLIVLGLSN
jgi:hypothetical protein